MPSAGDLPRRRVFRPSAARGQIFLPRSPQNMNKEGGEPMMIATLLIGTASLAAMVTGFVVMIRD
jgi:hypothetical protein